jgi:PLP dependent protein
MDTHFSKLELINIIKENWKKVYDKAQETTLSCGRNFEHIKIIAVSKTQSSELVIAGIESGIEIFGENYVQEIKEKYDFLQNNYHKQPIWHFIGHLQSNKVKIIVPLVDMIQTVDSIKIAAEISNELEKYSRNLDILLQVNTSGEDTKSGCEPDEINFVIEDILKHNHLNLKGLMTIGTFTDDEYQQRKEFSLLRNLFEKANQDFPELKLTELSMGMTHDFPVAIQEGATIIRVGTAIFGERNYYH